MGSWRGGQDGEECATCFCSFTDLEWHTDVVFSHCRSVRAENSKKP